MHFKNVLALIILSTLLTGCSTLSQNEKHDGSEISDPADIGQSYSTSSEYQSLSTSSDQQSSTSGNQQSSTSGDQQSSTSGDQQSSTSGDQQSSTSSDQQPSSTSSETHEPSNSRTEPSVIMTTEFAEYGADTTTIKYTLTNNGDMDFAYSNIFYLQRNKNGQWTNIPFTNESFNSLGIILPAQKTSNGSVVLENRVELPLTPGEYRLGKGDGDTVYAEFTVK